MQPAPSYSGFPFEPVPENRKQSISRAATSAAVNPFSLESLPAGSSLFSREITSLSWHIPAFAQAIPLRVRDLQVLIELFNRNEIDAIESDILRNLDWRCPEPCWEDDPFEFLRDFL